MLSRVCVFGVALLSLVYAASPFADEALRKQDDVPVLPIEVPKFEQLSSIQSQEPASGIYWVIGSFRNYGDAHFF